MNTVKTRVHNPEESQKACYEMFQPYRLNALASLKIKKTKGGGGSEGDNVFNKDRAEHQLGPATKGGKVSKKGPANWHMGSTQGRSKTAPRLRILEFQGLGSGLFQTPESAAPQQPS